MNREQIIETMARGMFDACPPLRLTGEPIQWDDTKSFTPMNCRADAAAALSALEAAGLVIVPVEPGEMFVRNRELKGVTIHDFPSGTGTNAMTPEYVIEQLRLRARFRDEYATPFDPNLDNEAARVIEEQAAEIAKFREGIAEGKEMALEFARILKGQAVLLDAQKGPRELVAKSRILSAEYETLSAEYEALSRRLPL